MNTSLTQLQAFNAMTKLLDDYYNNTSSDDVGSLLGGMSFLEDGYTADPAVWGEWLEFINNKSLLTKQEAFEGMIKFLEYYQENTSSDDVRELIDSMLFTKKEATALSYKNLWEKHVEEVLKEREGSRYYLKLTK